MKKLEQVGEVKQYQKDIVEFTFMLTTGIRYSYQRIYQPVSKKKLHDKNTKDLFELIRNADSLWAPAILHKR